jgi:hypothetical protein
MAMTSTTWWLEVKSLAKIEVGCLGHGGGEVEGRGRVGGRRRACCKPYIDSGLYTICGSICSAFYEYFLVFGLHPRRFRLSYAGGLKRIF